MFMVHMREFEYNFLTGCQNVTIWQNLKSKSLKQFAEFGSLHFETILNNEKYEFCYGVRNSAIINMQYSAVSCSFAISYSKLCNIY